MYDNTEKLQMTFANPNEFKSIMQMSYRIIETAKNNETEFKWVGKNIWNKFFF